MIFRWLSTRYIRGIYGAAEKCNMGFNVTEFRNIGNESGSSSLVLSRKYMEYMFDLAMKIALKGIRWNMMTVTFPFTTFMASIRRVEERIDGF